MLRVVAYYEFLATVKRKSYYLVTLGMPVIALLYTGFAVFLGYVTARSELEGMSKPIAVVDQSGILTAPGAILHPMDDQEIYEYQDTASSDKKVIHDQLERLDIPIAKRRIQRFNRLEDAWGALKQEVVRSVVLIPPDYLESNSLTKYVKRESFTVATDRSQFLDNLLGGSILKQSGVPSDKITQIQLGPRITTLEWDVTSNSFVKLDLWRKGLAMGVPLTISLLLFVVLMMNGSLLLASVAEEKENKVMEVILSSASSTHLLFGKVLGLVAAGLLQAIIWLAMVSVIPLLATFIADRPIAFEFDLSQLAISVVFLVAAFVFYGVLLAGMGSLGSSYRDSQQLTVFVILLPTVPLMILPALINEPNGTAARILSYIPLFSPTAMMLRLGIGEVPLWDMGLSLLILLISVWVAVRVSGKLFRIGTLTYGKRPGIPAIIKALVEPT